MFIVVYIYGCLPYLSLATEKDGEVIMFELEKAALLWAKLNCAWEYRVYKW